MTHIDMRIYSFEKYIQKVIKGKSYKPKPSLTEKASNAAMPRSKTHQIKSKIPNEQPHLECTFNPSLPITQ
jgi:hypothetical protein